MSFRAAIVACIVIGSAFAFFYMLSEGSTSRAGPPVTRITEQKSEQVKILPLSPSVEMLKQASLSRRTLKNNRKTASIEAPSREATPTRDFTPNDDKGSPTESLGQDSAKNSIGLRLSIESSRLEVTDLSSRQKVILYAPAIEGVEVSPVLALSKEYLLFANIGLRYVRFNLPPTFGLTRSSLSLLDFETGVSDKFSDAFQLSLGAGYSQELSLSSNSASVISVDRMGIPNASLTADYAYYKKEYVTLGMQLGFNFLLPGNAPHYSSTIGNKNSLLFYAIKHTDNLDFFCGLGGQYLRFNTSFSEVNEMSLVFQLGIQSDVLSGQH